MTTKPNLRRWLVYKAELGISIELWTELLKTHGPGVEVVLLNSSSSGDHHKLLEVGDRTSIHEYTPDKTHWRKSPWVVSQVQVYTPDIPVGMEFDEIVIYTCAYSPLPEAENPWIAVKPRADLRHMLKAADEFIGLMGLTRKQLEEECLRLYGTLELPVEGDRASSEAEAVEVSQ